MRGVTPLITCALAGGLRQRTTASPCLFVRASGLHGTVRTWVVSPLRVGSLLRGCGLVPPGYEGESFAAGGICRARLYYAGMLVVEGRTCGSAADCSLGGGLPDSPDGRPRSCAPRWRSPYLCQRDNERTRRRNFVCAVLNLNICRAAAGSPSSRCIRRAVAPYAYAALRSAARA